MLHFVDRVDAGKLTAEEINDPQGWILLGFIMDPRTGLGRFREFRTSNYQLMADLIEYCRTMPIEDILAHPDVQERVVLYYEQADLFTNMVKAHTTVQGPVIITDLRGHETIYAGNRFAIYGLYPKQNVSVWVVDGRNKENCAIAVGYSILNRTATANIASIMLSHGGGGHKQVGTCQVPYDQVDAAMADIIKRLQ